ITSLRSKEEAHDYRYFPEPDLVPLEVTAEMLEAARSEIPELPAERAERYERDLGLDPARARQLAFRAELGDFFEQALESTTGRSAGGTTNGEGPAVPADPSVVANWVGDDLVSRIGDADPADTPVTPQALASLVALVAEKQVTTGAARQVLDKLVAGGGDPAAIVEAEGLGAMGGDDELVPLVREALAANADAAEKIRGGKMGAIGPIIGHVMRATQGRADGGEVTKLVRRELGV
ncbi:MAG TPA: Asp-tRNA(Asn)/Glu-tRNA(Gln) amidotransferase GatCAB subunit B, partial [Solirubrobacteraceae bacterium]